MVAKEKQKHKQKTPFIVKSHQMELFPALPTRFEEAAKRNVLRRFVGHLVDKPWCSTDPENVGSWISPSGYALERPYIQHQAPWAKAWLWVDVDHPFCPEDRFPLAPSLMICSPNGNYHAAWELRTPVLYGHRNNPQPQRWLENLRARMETALEADSGFTDSLVKNPFSDAWYITRVGRGRYDLRTIDRALAGVEPATKPQIADPDQGRNPALFESLRWRAYRLKPHYRSFQGFYEAVAAEAHDLNMIVGPASGKGPLSRKEVGQVIRSVATWTWRHYTGTGKSDAERQRDQRRRAGAVPRDAYLAQAGDRRAQTLLLAADGLSIRQIADRLGVGKSQVHRYLQGG